MEHVAIMKKSWGLTKKILTGEKTAESRWYKTRRSPWERIKPGETIYFKDSGEPVRVRARITRVLQFSNLTPTKAKRILTKYGRANLGLRDIMLETRRYVLNKNYCILIFFDRAKEIKPFDINKVGFGAMSAWISVNNISKFLLDSK